MLAPTIWFLFFFVAPMALVWGYSFGENDGLLGVKITGTIKNYAQAFDPEILKVLRESVVLAAIATFVCLILAFPVAIAMTFASDKAKSWLLLLIMLPFWTNLLIRTYALIAVMRTEGLINHSFEWLHGIAVMVGIPVGDYAPMPLLYNKFAVVIGLVYVHLPFMVLPLYAALDRLDRSLIEASLDLGAGHLQTMYKVVAPLALPGIAAGLVITFIPAMGAYLTPDLLGGPDDLMIASLIERQFKRANNWPFGSALSFLLMYITMIFFVLRSYFEAKGGKVAVH
ncbi:MAG: spermidine/putrescine transport system permease protein [Hyphomonadaceae bacterium]|nr:MAG: spermidine/putrescine transport system permease protein [Hyphomonadaceae bacterium]KAF0187016.1 MAG: spermidine/putrescine transport system permease protein [Hyphomonadaceae bacterium]